MYLPADGSDNTTIYEVLYDEEFLGGLSIRGSSISAYRLPPSCLINLSYGRAQHRKGAMTTHPNNWRQNSSPSAAPYYANDRRNPYFYYTSHGMNPYPVQQGGLVATGNSGQSPRSSQQHHLQQVQSRTEPLRAASSGAHKQPYGKGPAAVVERTQRSDRQKVEKVEGADKTKKVEPSVNKGQ